MESSQEGPVLFPSGHGDANRIIVGNLKYHLHLVVREHPTLESQRRLIGEISS